MFNKYLWNNYLSLHYIMMLLAFLILSRMPLILGNLQSKIREGHNHRMKEHHNGVRKKAEDGGWNWHTAFQ